MSAAVRTGGGSFFFLLWLFSHTINCIARRHHGHYDETIVRRNELCMSESMQRVQPASFGRPLGRPCEDLPEMDICRQLPHITRCGTEPVVSYGGKEGSHLIWRFSMCLRI